MTSSPDIVLGHGQYSRRGGISLPDFEKLQAQQPPPTEPRPDVVAETPQTMPLPKDAARIYASDDRIWQAIAGHGIDEQRLPKLVFQALRFVALFREAGVEQSKLRALVGQDKRSLPPRTETLATKGYVDKSVIWANGFKTSLITHKKPTLNGPTTWSYETTIARSVFVNDSLYLDPFLDFLIKNMGEVNIMTMSDLYHALGIENDKRKRAKVWRAFERLDLVGITERCMAPTPLTMKSGKTRYLRCVKLLKVPSAEERKKAHAFGGKDSQSLYDLLSQKKAAQDLEKDAAEPVSDRDESEVDATEITVDGEVDDDELPDVVASYQFPQWDPDDFYPNLIYETIRAGGIQGMNSTVSIVHELRDRIAKRCIRISETLLLDHSLCELPNS
jgi:hypothetical protein